MFKTLVQDKMRQRLWNIPVGLPQLSGHFVSWLGLSLLPSPGHNLSLRTVVSTWCPCTECRVPRFSSDPLQARKESHSMLRVNSVAC